MLPKTQQTEETQEQVVQTALSNGQNTTYNSTVVYSGLVDRIKDNYLKELKEKVLKKVTLDDIPQPLELTSSSANKHKNTFTQHKQNMEAVKAF